MEDSNKDLVKPHATHLEHTTTLSDGFPGEDSDFIYVPGSAEEKALVRKIDIRLMPMLWCMYVFNYIDRTNIGNAKTGGMQADLHLSSSDYSLALSIFFIGYLLNEIPMNLILTRSRPSIFLPTLMMIWGAMSVGAKGISSLGGLVGWRFMLGIVEAGFFPGVLLVMSTWYKPYEFAKRIAFFYSASLVSGAFGGILGGVLTSYMDGVGHTRGWKWLFVIEGIITCVIASVAYFILPDFPQNTKWLTPHQKQMAILRLHDKSDDEERLTHMQAFVAACKDWKTWAFALVYSLINGAGTISYFFPTLMTSLGYSGRNAQFMTVPIYMVSLIISVSLGFTADAIREKAYMCSGAALFAGAMFLATGFLKNNTARYVLICFGGGGIWSAIPLFLGYFATNFEGKEKRAVCIAIINGIGNLASVYGSFLWPATDAPQYRPGFGATAGFIWGAAIICFACRYHLGNTNAAEDAKEQAHHDVANAQREKRNMNEA